MTSQNNNTPNFSGQENFVDEIDGKSDRAVAIVGAAFLDSHVAQLLESFFTDDYDNVRALLDEDRPIGNFGTRIRLAYVLGLLSKEERDDLWSILQIREFFIREMGEIRFTDDPLREWCYWLRLPRKILLTGQTMTPRKLFVFATALLVRQLTLRIEQAARMRRRTANEFTMKDAPKG